MKIAIVGYGIEGRALARYFAKHKHDITICAKEDLGGHIKKHKWSSKIGQRYLENLHEFDVVFRSPGVAFLKKELNPVRGKLSSMTRYFFDKCPCPIIGITGTKGKGTVATLLYEILKIYRETDGGKVFLGGNIGEPAINFLDSLSPNDIVILELSSFQLQDLEKSPHMAIVLGITPDHMNYHRDMEEYVKAKMNIVKFQRPKDFAIIDADNNRSFSFIKHTKAKKLTISVERHLKEGAFLYMGNLMVRIGETNTVIGNRDRVKLIGLHNIKNILAAAAAACVLKVPVEFISKTVSAFCGLPHRLEFIKEHAGVRYYNDSASTNPETTIAALRSFHNPTILIAGGCDKNLDFTDLGEEIAKLFNVKTVILMGDIKPKLEKAIEEAINVEEKRLVQQALRINRPVRRRDIPLELISADTYQEAFMVAKMLAQPGDTVLFSPGAASFDMFKDYKERGDAFRNFVEDITT